MEGLLNKRKLIYIEILRIVAAFLVIFNHLPGYSLYSVSYGHKQWIYMFIAMITRINVPVFFMISGALLLEREESVGCILKRRFVKMFLVLLTFEFIMYIETMLFTWRKSGEFAFSTKDFLCGFLSGNISGTGAYWYIYAYLGMLLLLPFLRAIARNMDVEKFWLLIALHAMINSMIPFVNLIGDLSDIKWSIVFEANFSVPLATEKAFFYPLIGYYVDHRIDIKTISKEKCGLLMWGSLLCILLESICTYIEYKHVGQMSQNYVQMFDYVLAITVFIVIKKISNEKKNALKRFDKIIYEIGGATLIIYLMDQFYKYLLYNKIENYFKPALPTLIISMIWCILSMSLGYISSKILKKIPGFKCIL